MRRQKKIVLAVITAAAVTVGSVGVYYCVEDKTVSEAAQDSEAPTGTPPSGTPPTGGPGGEAPGGAPGGGTSESVTNYTAVQSITTDTTLDGDTITSTGTDENAVWVSEGALATLKNITVDRTSSDSTGGDNSSFYGVGAAVLTTKGTTNLTNSTITTDAAGGAGVFSYGDGVTYVSDSTITTKQDTSGGIHAAGGGTLYAWDLTVNTSGQSSAAIRSDRGGGTMVVDGGTYTSNGVGSPAVYSTADITANDAVLTANSSEAVCIEGRNSLRLFDTALTGNMGDDDQNDCTWNVILYQSMSGDSEVGNSVFEMVGGSLSAKNGGMFYTTNTQSTFVLKDVDITNADDSEFFLRCTGNQNQRGWGTSGSNGADCTFTAISQEMQGDLQWDSISQLDFYMKDGSTLTGAVVQDESCAGDGGDGYCNLYLSEDSTWVVTGNSTLSALSNAGTIVDSDGKTVTVAGTDGTVYVEGDSGYTVTVSSYSAAADLSGASEVSSWSDYEVDRTAASSQSGTSEPSSTATAAPASTASAGSSSTVSGTTQQTETTDSSSASTLKKSKITKAVRNKNGKKITLKWKKVSGADGYQIRYTTRSSSGKKITKTIRTTGTKKTLKRLKAGRTYKISVRAYQKSDGKYIYGKWSAVKKVKKKE